MAKLEQCRKIVTNVVARDSFRSVSARTCQREAEQHAYHWTREIFLLRECSETRRVQRTFIISSRLEDDIRGRELCPRELGGTPVTRVTERVTGRVSVASVTARLLARPPG